MDSRSCKGQTFKIEDPKPQILCQLKELIEQNYDANEEASLHAEEGISLGPEEQNTGSNEDEDDETVVIINDEDED